MFQTTEGKGFWITFANGYTVSVQFGRGNYSDNYREGSYDAPAAPSRTAEIAAWDGAGDWLEEDPRAYQTPAEALEFMNMVASLPA